MSTVGWKSTTVGRRLRSLAEREVPHADLWPRVESATRTRGRGALRLRLWRPLPAGLALVLLAAIALTTIAYADGHLRWPPRVVKELPPRQDVRLVPPSPTFPDLEELQRTAGFELLVPTYVPEGWVHKEGTYSPPLRQAEIWFEHPQNRWCCLIVHERIGGTIGRVADADPAAVREVVVGGQPALHVHGAWLEYPPGTKMRWVSNNGPQMLQWHAGQYLLRISTCCNEPPLEELIRIGESLRPLSAPTNR